MSAPFHYNSGPAASAQMKADLRRVRATRPDRYVVRKVTEQRMGQDGFTANVTVTAQPDAVPMSPRDRHKMFAGSK